MGKIICDFITMETETINCSMKDFGAVLAPSDEGAVMAQKSAMTGGEIAKDGVFSPSVAYGASSLIRGSLWVLSVSNYNLTGCVFTHPVLLIWVKMPR